MTITYTSTVTTTDIETGEITTSPIIDIDTALAILAAMMEENKEET